MSSQLPPGTDLSKVPAGTAPPGVIPNLDNPESLTPTLIGLCTFLIGWGTSFAVIRVWNNWKKLNAGDVAHYFRHSWDLPLSWYTPTYLKQIYAQSMLLGPTIFFSKEAIFLLYFEIFHVKKDMRIAIIVGMVFTGFVYWAGIIVESIFCAAHIGETWDPLAGARIAKRCPKTEYWGIVQGACAIIIDIYIFVLPIPAIVRLQLATRRKIQILSVFMTAFLGILASVFAELYRVRLLTNPANDQWGQSQQLIYVIVENWVAVIVSCMPAFATASRSYFAESQLFKSLQARLFSWTSDTRFTPKNHPTERDTLPLNSQRVAKPSSSSSATGTYYSLEERVPVSNV